MSQHQAIRAFACPRCGNTQGVTGRGLRGPGEVVVFVLLFALGLLPGVIYYIVRESRPFCPACGARMARLPQNNRTRTDPLNPR